VTYPAPVVLAQGERSNVPVRQEVYSLPAVRLGAWEWEWVCYWAQVSAHASKAAALAYYCGAVAEPLVVALVWTVLGLGASSPLLGVSCVRAAVWPRAYC
jgi:hypothetical protein